jgi:hypothetical protein
MTSLLILLSLIDLSPRRCPHVCQWIDGATPARLAALRSERRASKREFHATVYDITYIGLYITYIGLYATVYDKRRSDYIHCSDSYLH